MIEKETPWEKRNLGVDSSIEFFVDNTEEWKDIAHIILNHNEEYQVLHVASGNTDVLLNASNNGFLPIEMNIQLVKKLDEIILPTIFKRFKNNISCDISSLDEKTYILESIKNGHLFTTDKVARDPYFGVEYAGRRYAYWTEDLLANGATLLSMKYKNHIVAFDILVDSKDGIAEAFLGGLLPEYLKSGLGFIGVYYIAKYAQSLGFKKVITGVSSNNLPILKLHEIFDYRVESASYCLIKHKDNPSRKIL